ncbi:MAG: hypothetical protein BGO98_02305 [Myxococcales bacterium 68-20]|nr:hypothetical protein [Myxococcales bacterium]OJY21681.1 MAG: hypothetical protein BGO98_02305 [Myxococcales bacterium 68-20]
MKRFSPRFEGHRPSGSRRVAAALGALLLVTTVTAAGCKPEFSERPSEVENYRVLAIQAEPAEWQRIVDPDTGLAKPAKYRALVVNPLGTVDKPELEWAFCTLPKPLTELNDVNIKCFQNDPAYLVNVGTGPDASAEVPENTCRQFGPDVPEDQSFRPADPDVTGGYYQPLRVLYRPDGGRVIPALGKVRIRCGLPGASQEQITQFNRNYHLNTNPTIERVTAQLPSGEQALEALEVKPDAEPLIVGPGQTITLRASWPACPTNDVCGDGYCGPTETKEKGVGQCEDDCKVERACGGAERYLAFSLETRQVTEVREVMRASWFAVDGGGAFRDDRSGRSADDLATFAENEFTAPTTPGVYPIWVVLRDDRGGVTWSSVRVRVQ